MNYAVRINGRYINNCDDFWYDTVNYFNPVFTLCEAQKMIELLRKRFQYYVDIISADEDEVQHYEFGKLKMHTFKNKPAEEYKQEELDAINPTESVSKLKKLKFCLFKKD